jgi:CDP-diacylglycerol--glycerol-3-phosphate 3-phosphatidyltransferase
MKQLPNFLTYSRIIIIPILMITFYMESPISDWVTAGLFTAAAITDYFDGHLARKWGVQSRTGQVLDPIADKLLVATALLLLLGDDRAHVLPVLVILCRELMVSGLREVLAESRISLPVTQLAKYKTFSQLFAIGFLLWAPGVGEFREPMTLLGTGLLWLAGGLTVITGYDYMKRGMRHIGQTTTKASAAKE